ncbi:hypothetical protein BB8028_0004g12700 [Beauveria bassiana]|uniref:Uncharacterized protein n=2 Tax=Beauveria bassiana TaxID=176275 RepID=A0A0A2VKW2_BEABA|nr:hypothetical protein BBAD15_g7889 [Beauveria bassiana D1-5]PQK14340.1 hypothetical protein BB8028_0004g12700 [Beauveria bassiana]
MPMPSKVTLTVGSLIAVSVIVAVASRLSCMADLFSAYASPDETDDNDEKRTNVKGSPAWSVGTPESEREAGTCTAWRSAADAFSSERTESVPHMAGVEKSGNGDQEEALVKSWDNMEASPGSHPSDRSYDADNDADDDDDDVWDMLQGLEQELKDAQKNSSALRLQLDEARADVCALQIRVAQHETRARLASEDLDVAIEDNHALHAQNRRLQIQLQEASNENATLREGLAAAAAVGHALKGRETELRGTRKALQGLREAHIELIEAASQRRS